MDQIRKPFQGVSNIIRFNWHFYLLSLLAITSVYALFYCHIISLFQAHILCFSITAGTLISLFVSFYIYDLSGLYSLNWLTGPTHNNEHIVNIHAGFDETSILLIKKYRPESFSVFDFYDPVTHTEISIKRARKTYPQVPGTQKISTSHIPMETGSADRIFIIFSAHEIRQEKERNIFFEEIRRVTKPSGEIIVTEHLRDLPNFIAYNIGFFHFLSRRSWVKTFSSARLFVNKEIKLTPFVNTFILRLHDTAS